jgi:arylsulfatase A-like enzyme
MSISRRAFFKGTAAALAGAAASRSHATPGRKPNVVYLFSDEHRWQSLSFTEMPNVRTPHMASLAKQGVSFNYCISNYPVCSPHRAMLMTGRWPYQQGVIDNGIALSPEETTLGKVFKAAGYDTAYIGKWHLGGVRAEPFGFDDSLIWTDDNTHWDKSKYHPHDGGPVQPKGYNATLMTDQALAFIEERRERPFFLMVSWNPPHSNFLDAPGDKKALYPEGSLPWRKNVPAATTTSSAEPAIWDQNSWPYYQGYHAHISAIDGELRRILARLDALGLGDDTILVYSSDHGSMMGSHGIGGKRQPFEESIRVPFLVRWPGIVPHGKSVDALFGAIDIMPTLCGLAGIPIPSTCVGHDFSPSLRGKKGPEPEAQLLMHISKKNASGGETHPAPLFRGLRTRRHTFVVRPDGPWCLFDNKEDPYQMKNLMDDPSTRALRDRLTAMLRQRLDEAHDPFTLPKAGPA